MYVAIISDSRQQEVQYHEPTIAQGLFLGQFLHGDPLSLQWPYRPKKPEITVWGILESGVKTVKKGHQKGSLCIL